MLNGLVGKFERRTRVVPYTVEQFGVECVEIAEEHLCGEGVGERYAKVATVDVYPVFEQALYRLSRSG